MRTDSIHPGHTEHRSLILNLLISERDHIIEQCQKIITTESSFDEKEFSLFMLELKKLYQKCSFWANEKNNCRQLFEQHKETDKTYTDNLREEVCFLEELMDVYNRTLTEYQIEKIETQIKEIDFKVGKKYPNLTNDVNETLKWLNDSCKKELENSYHSKQPLEEILFKFDQITENLNKDTKLLTEKKQLRNLLSEHSENIEMLKTILFERHSREQPLKIFTSENNNILLSSCKTMVSYLDSKKKILETCLQQASQQKRTENLIAHFTKAEKKEEENWLNHFRSHRITPIPWADPKGATLYSYSLSLEALLYTMLRFDE